MPHSKDHACERNSLALCRQLWVAIKPPNRRLPGAATGFVLRGQSLQRVVDRTAEVARPKLVERTGVQGFHLVTLFSVSADQAVVLRASTDAGRSRPSDLAVFRLTTSSYLVGVGTGRSAGFAPALIGAILGHAGAAPTSASSSFKARTKLPGGPRRGLGLSQTGRQMPALLSFTFLDLKCGSTSSRAVPPV